MRFAIVLLLGSFTLAFSPPARAHDWDKEYYKDLRKLEKRRYEEEKKGYEDWRKHQRKAEDAYRDWLKKQEKYERKQYERWQDRYPPYVSPDYPPPVPYGPPPFRFSISGPRGSISFG